MIELKVDEFKDCKVTFHISRQDKEDYKRLNAKPFTLKLSDGSEYKLESSCSFPYFYGEKAVKELCVRGDNRSSDYDRISVSISEYLNIFVLVQKYNEKFS